MMRKGVDFDRLVELRGQYPLRGPRDGRAGVTPEGTVSPVLRYRLESVMWDADSAMRMGKDDHARWRAGMGLDEPIAPPQAWHDQCPARPSGLTHMREASDPPGRCAHCGAEGLVWRPRR